MTTTWQTKAAHLTAKIPAGAKIIRPLRPPEDPDGGTLVKLKSGMYALATGGTILRSVNQTWARERHQQRYYDEVERDSRKDQMAWWKG